MLRPCKSRGFRGEPETIAAAGAGVKPKCCTAIGRSRRGAAKRVCYHSPQPQRPVPTEKNLATPKELSDFLASVERRAFKQTVFAVHEDQAALDIVQDSMMKLAEKYAAKPAAELPLLFQRILQNTMRDHFRRQKVRSTWTTLLSNLGLGGDDDDFDPLETFEVDDDSNIPTSPADQLEQSQVMASIEEAVKALPARQREAFMLRYWEELDVSETAKAMGCSEGSVKTHCSRATHALAKVLRAKGITL
jgi:RNA polymerase sigma-70 factor (ECF subfamily)